MVGFGAFEIHSLLSCLTRVSAFRLCAMALERSKQKDMPNQIAFLPLQKVLSC